METNNDIPAKPTGGKWGISIHEKELIVSYPFIVADCHPEHNAHTRIVTKEEAEANAAHIVKCVNNFDSVLEALKKTLAFIIDTGCESELIDETENVIKSLGN